ncbi:MAG: hypothetical protein U5J98_10600 [Halobacteriales archaeon]|nr:hypothetical protein [Halobacteriales archaeon]
MQPTRRSSAPAGDDAERPVGRRELLAGLGTAAAASLAGCTGGLSGDGGGASPTAARPSPGEGGDGAYVPTHRDMMQMIGMQRDGRLVATLSYTVPHQFFLVTGTRTNQATIADGDTMHLMVQVMDGETGVVAPGVEPTIELTKDGEAVGANQPWPMLSQSMGFHFGDNVAPSGEGAWRFDVTVNAANGVLSTDLADVFTKRTFSFEREFAPEDAAELGFMGAGGRAGDPGVLAPMSMEMMTVPQQPAFDALPIEVTDPQLTDDVAAAVGTHDDPAALGFDGGEAALVVATQTRYNRYQLGFMGLRATVTRGGEEVFAGDLSSAVDGGLGHYYGAATPALEAGDEVEVEFVTPPQVARHVGYETAFLQLEPLTFTL